MFTKISIAAIIVAIIIVVITAFSTTPQSKTYSYTDPSGQFSLQYSNAYDVNQRENNRIGFSKKNTGGFELMGVIIEPTTFSTIDQMVKTTNEKRAHPIRIYKKEEAKGVTWYYLKTPIVVDHSMDDQEILADGDSAVFIKHKKLYTFQLREQMADPQVVSDFYQIVKSFQFIENR